MDKPDWVQEELLPRKVGLLPAALGGRLPRLQRGVQTGHQSIQLQGEDVGTELGRETVLVKAGVDVTLQILENE